MLISQLEAKLTFRMLIQIRDDDKMSKDGGQHFFHKGEQIDMSLAKTAGIDHVRRANRVLLRYKICEQKSYIVWFDIGTEGQLDTWECMVNGKSV